MINELKISTLTIISVLCTVMASGAYGASSVRSFGGATTYSSAGAASAANTSSPASGASASAGTAARGGSLRVNSSGNKTGTAVKPATPSSGGNRVSSMPRLSIGKYLGGGVSVSGGSSARPQLPGGSGGNSGSSGGSNPGLSGDIEADINNLQTAVEKLGETTTRLSDDVAGLAQDKQDLLLNGDIIYVAENNELMVDVAALTDELEKAGFNSAKLEIDYQNDSLVWKYENESDWKVLVTRAQLLGDIETDISGINTNLTKAIDDIAALTQRLDNVDTQIATMPTVDDLAKLAAKEDVDASIAEIKTTIEQIQAGEGVELNDYVKKTELAAADYATNTAVTTALLTKANNDTVEGIQKNVAALDTGLASAIATADAAKIAAAAAQTTADGLKATTESIASTANTAAAAADAAKIAAAAAQTTADAAKTAVAGKQDALTFDDTPRAGSENPVTSGGIFAAIAAVETGSSSALDNYVTKDELSAELDIPTAGGTYMLTINNGQKQWMPVTIVTDITEE